MLRNFHSLALRVLALRAALICFFSFSPFWGPSLAVALLLAGSPVQAAGFNETTTGKNEEDQPRFGGISEAEAAAMKKSRQQIYERFKKGRASSNKDQASRYSGFLEMHDENMDAITDHEPGTDNLEGQAERGAFGKTPPTGQKRLEEIKGVANDPTKTKDLIVNNSGLCEKGIIKGSITRERPQGLPCNNVSAGLIDVGAAHGGPEGPHRAYKLKDDVVENSKKAGKSYAERAIREATELDVQAEGLKNYQNVGRDKTKIRVKKLDGSMSQTIDVAPSFDMLQSDTAWLEEQKKRRVDLNWRVMRVTRLALGKKGSSKGGSSTMEVDDELSNMANNPKYTEADLAQRVAEQRAFAFLRDRWVKMPEAKILSSPPSRSQSYQCDDETPALPVPKWKNCSTLDEAMQKLSSAEAKTALWDKAKADYKRQDNSRYEEKMKSIAKSKQQILDCMARDVWCNSIRDEIGDLEEKKRLLMQKGATLPNPQLQAIDDQITALEKKERAGEYYTVVSEPGDAFNDSRELTAANTSQAMEGGLDNYMSTISNLDFNKESVDRQVAGATNKPYEELEEQVRKAKEARDALIQYERAREKAGDGSYQSSFLQSRPQSSNATRIFNRDPAKLGNSLDTGAAKPSSVADFSNAPGALPRPSAGTRSPIPNGSPVLRPMQ